MAEGLYSSTNVRQEVWQCQRVFGSANAVTHQNIDRVL